MSGGESKTEEKILRSRTQGLVYSVSFSPDGTRIVSGSRDNSVRVWDAASGELLKVLGGHTDEVLSVSFSPDGTRIVSGEDESVLVWDASSGELLKVLEGHDAPVTAVSFSPDGSRIVSGSYDKTVQVWDAASGDQLKTLVGHTDYVMSVSFSPDGSRIVSGSYDKSVRVWDAAIAYAIMVDEDDDHWNAIMVDEDSDIFASDDSDIMVDEDSDIFASDDSDDDEHLPVPEVNPPDEDCAICREGLNSMGYVVRLNCGHFFHAACIRRWQNAGESNGYQLPGKTCPLCRHIATDNTYADGILRLRF